MTNNLDKTWQLLDAQDVPGTVRHLRTIIDELTLTDLGMVVERLAATVGFDDLATAARQLAEKTRPQTLYDFGSACTERGVAFIGLPALREGLRLAPDSPALLTGLVSALEEEYRHAEAAAVLEEREATLRAWPDRYLLVFNTLMAGELPRAADHFARLTAPDDDRWTWAHARLRTMLKRADAAGQHSPLDARDLRGWHYALNGGYLTTLSPYGFDAGMTGRHAFVGDSYGQCLYGLRRLALVLAAADRRPRTVSLLPDRSSRILGLAAAQVLGLPAEPFDPARGDTVVVAYDLKELDPELASVLRERTPGQVVYEHATCWTDPPAVTADVSTLLRQAVVVPWGAHHRYPPGGDPVQVPADDRPAEEVAAEIVAADATPDTGDGATPADVDSDEALAAFVTATRGHWLQGARARVTSPGPVPSSRFR